METMKKPRPGGRSGLEDERPAGRVVVVQTIPRLDDVRPVELQARASTCWHLRSRGLAPAVPWHVLAALQRRGWWQ